MSDKDINKHLRPQKNPWFRKLENLYINNFSQFDKHFRSRTDEIWEIFNKESKFLYLNIIGLVHEYLQKDFPPGWKDRNIGIEDYEKNPIILLHGYAQNRGVFIDMAEKLREHGFELIYRLNHDPWKDIKKNIEYINSRIDQILVQCKPESGKVDLIGHSLGGLTARYYSYLFPDKVDYCIMLGAPHNGTYLAYFGLLGFLGKYLKIRKYDGMSAFQMIPGGKFLKEINAIKPSSNVKYINIFSENDEVIIFENSEIVDGHINIDVKSDAGIGGVGHISLIHDPAVIDLICEILNNSYGNEAQLRFYEDYDEEYKQIIPVREGIKEEGFQ